MGEVKPEAAKKNKKIKERSVYLFKGQFQFWLTLQTYSIGFIPPPDTKTPLEVQEQDEE